MLNNKNLYQHRPPLQPIQAKSFNLHSNYPQSALKTINNKYQDTETSDKRMNEYQNRSNSKSYRKNVYEIDNAAVNRRAKPYCPLQKAKTVLDEQVMKKSREYVQSSEYKNYMNAVNGYSRNRQDLLQNMKKNRSNNIYLPISQTPTINSHPVIKSQERKPIFSKIMTAADNEQSSDFDFTIDHLSKIEEKQAINLQNKANQGFELKYNYDYSPKFDIKPQNPNILIKDQSDDQITKKNSCWLQKNHANKTPECIRSPIFTTSVKKYQNKLERQLEVSQTKRRYCEPLSAQKQLQRIESTNKFINYQEIKYAKKSEKYQIRQTNQKHSYLQTQKCQRKRQSSTNRFNNKAKLQNTGQNSNIGARYETNSKTIQSNSIYNVDFKLQRPLNYSQCPSSFKKPIYSKFQYQCQTRSNNFKENRQTNLNVNDDTPTNSRSRSKGKLSIVTMSKSTNLIG